MSKLQVQTVLARIVATGAVAVVLAGAPSHALTPFETETVDAGEFLGQHTSVAVDANGDPHISYYDAITGRLKYATKQGDTWLIEVADDPIEIVGQHSSIALDSNENPHIAYYDITSSRLKYASRDANGTWTTEVVEDGAQDVGQYASLKIDSGDTPHIAYYDDTLNRLKYAFKGGIWFLSVVDDPAEDVGRWASLDLDNSDRAHIAYFDASTPSIQYAVNLGSTWEISFVGSDPMDAGHVSLALDASGRAHIAYLQDTEIRYAVDDDYPNWDHYSIHAGNGYTSIAVDEAGTPRVAFYSRELGSDQNLAFGLRNSDGTWAVENVDRVGDVGQYCSLALDRQGNARISYYHVEQGVLRYADASVRLVDPLGGENWPVGAERDVRWQGVGPVDLRLSTDGGRSWDTIASNVLDEVIRVRVPHAPTRFALVQVQRLLPFSTSESDSFFTIETDIALLMLKVTQAPAGKPGALVTWETDPGPADLAGYRLDRRHADGPWHTIVARTRETSYLDPEATPGTGYRLYGANGFGQEWSLGEGRFGVSRSLAAWPLPYRPQGRLSVAFAIHGALGATRGSATISLYDARGRLVRDLAQGDFPPGSQLVFWDGTDASGQQVPSGAYFLQAVSTGHIETLKILVTR